MGLTTRSRVKQLNSGCAKEATMDDFPDFMKRPENKIATSSQATPGVEGYVFDGADGSKMALWTCRKTAVSVPHVLHGGEPVAGTRTIRAFGGRRALRVADLSSYATT